MRIWVGEKTFEDAEEEYIEKIVSELKMMCDMAKAENIDNGRFLLVENNGENIRKEFVRILKESTIDTNLLFEFLPEQTEECLKRECEILRKIIN